MYRMMYKDAAQYVSRRNDIYYYVRRVPLDVRQHYASSRISFSLRTKSFNAALRTAHSVSQRLEDYWLGLRLQQMDIPAIHLIQVCTTIDNSPSIMEAVELYLSINGKDGTTFKRTARRNAEYVAKAIGNKPITSFFSCEAAQFRDWCLEQGMTISTVKRVFGSVRAIINLVMREHGIEGRNAFSGTFMPDRGDASTRQPIPTDKLITIQQRCQTTDDEPRWLVALISDTGMRLSEAAGLAREDIVLDADIPHVIIRPHPLDGWPATQALLDAAKEGLASLNLTPEIVSTGGTPNLKNIGSLDGATEHRSGTLIFNDRMMIAAGVAQVEDCALRIFTSVVSRASDNRGILDAGSKTLTSDPGGLEGYGLILEHPKAQISKMAEEHGFLELSDCDKRPEIGDIVRVVPNHVCVVVNMFDQLVVVSDDRIVDVLIVEARGRLV